MHTMHINPVNYFLSNTLQVLCCVMQCIYDSLISKSFFSHLFCYWVIFGIILWILFFVRFNESNVPKRPSSTPYKINEPPLPFQIELYPAGWVVGKTKMAYNFLICISNSIFRIINVPKIIRFYCFFLNKSILY